MTLTKHTRIPEHEDNEGKDYTPHMSSTDNLLSVWKKGKKHSNRFWQIWRDDYLLNLRERTTFKLKERRVLSHHEATIGDIVLIKDDLPRGMWKIRKIIELTVSSDGKIRSTKIMLPTNKTLNRTLNFLYSLECRDSDECSVGQNENDISEQELRSEDRICTDVRPRRRAAENARENIRIWTKDSEH
jgi:hypothetical protein